MPPSPPPLRVAIDARLFSGKSGGIEQVAIGLVDALSHLTDGDEQYLILAYPLSHDWIAPYAKGPCRLLKTTAVHPPPLWKRQLKKFPRIVSASRRARGWLARKSVTLSHSDGTIERAGVDVMHFIMQRAFFTKVPSIYHPHDLQHVHLPQFFSPREWAKRDLMLRTFCDQAKLVSCTSSWVKRDLMQQFGLSDGKVAIVELAGALSAYPNPLSDDLSATRTKYDLPKDFIFYPAQTWPHKNHLALLEAIALLRDRHGVTPPLVSSGHRTDHFAAIERRAAELNLSAALHFVGFVSPLELRCLYRLCRCVAIPTLFEAASGPMNEAFMAGAPVACSNVTSLPEQAGDSALIFDPHNPADIADALYRLWTDENLRQILIARGKQNVSRFTWSRTARHFRAHYRKLANRPLTEEDRALLSAKPML
jgi:glycosyltransferase involved in cell wall biosynthesis